MVLNKDGSFQRTAQFRGPDLDSAVPAELVAVAGCLPIAMDLSSHDLPDDVDALKAMVVAMGASSLRRKPG